jgi:prepilin-type N-terminal cleavage/methylation domain-containing protein
MKAIERFIQEQKGYTLIEVLVAMVLLLIVLIPLTQFTGHLIFNSANMDKINAINLAEKEMELCILTNDFISRSSNETINNRQFLIEREIIFEENLVTIIIQIKRLGVKKELTRLYTVKRYR